MGNFVKGIKALFTGPDTSANDALAADAAKQREQQSLQLDKQSQDLQNQQAAQDATSGRAVRQPRGRRLLLASTGEAGLSSSLGG